MNATIFHIPHASTFIPDRYLSGFLPGLEENLLRMTDWYTDELFDFGFGDRLVYPVSRLVCDPERFRDDEREEMAQIGMGVAYQTGYDLKPIRRKLTPEKREEILRAYYDPHHRKLNKLTEEKLALYRRCLIVDCHSFHATPLPYEKDGLRPDICLGTDDFHTPEWLSESLAKSFWRMGYTVSMNRPFAGTMVPLSHYGKDPRVLSVMIEVNRGLYMTENGEKKDAFAQMKRDIGKAIRSVVSALETISY
ncbi:MAG: N-formylglutamate amidohydrolase [Clostridia bacterium]|nr:N-formylglutamate amidohydrolase [Clostridia bacterium]